MRAMHLDPAFPLVRAEGMLATISSVAFSTGVLITMKLSRREFHRLAAAGAIAAPIVGLAQEKTEKTPAQSGPIPMAQKAQEAVAKQEAEMKTLRSHTLPYGLEPAFIFQAKARPRRAPAEIKLTPPKN